MYLRLLMTLSHFVVFFCVECETVERQNSSLLTVIKGLQADIGNIKQVARSQDRDIAVIQTSLSVLTEMVRTQTELISTSVHQLMADFHEMKGKQKKFGNDIREVSSAVETNKEKEDALKGVVADNNKDILRIKNVTIGIKKKQMKFNNDIRQLSSDVVMIKLKNVALIRNVRGNIKDIVGVKNVTVDIKDEIGKFGIDIYNTTLHLKNIYYNLTKLNKEVQNVEKEITDQRKKLEVLKHSVDKFRCPADHCVTFQSQCWCSVKDNQRQGIACGYDSKYSGRYYSIHSTGQPRDLILKLGLKPHAVYCKSNYACDSDCATNRCDKSRGVFDCWGTSLSCWNDKDRWSRNHPGIVRCTNYE